MKSIKARWGWRVAGSLFVILTTYVRPVNAVTLDECITTALSSNPDVRAATERAQAARYTIREARSAYYPLIGASASYARTDNPPQAFMMKLNQRSFSMQGDFNNPSDTENVALSLGVKYRLFDFGRSSLDNDMARAGEKLSILVLKGLQNDLIHQVTRGYYLVLQAGAFAGVQEELVQSLEESVRVAGERLKAGGAVRTDVLNLEVQLAQAKEDLIRTRNGVTLSVAALNAAIGTNIVTSAGVVANADNQALTKPDDKEDSGAVQDRPELQAARLMAEVTGMQAARGSREHWPTVSAFGSTDWNSDTSSSFERSYMIGVVAEVDLFDGFRRSSAAAGARARARAADAEAAKALNNLQLDLTSALLQLDEAWERLNVARLNIGNAEESRRITHERFKQGAATAVDVLAAQTGLTGSRMRSVAALYDFHAASSNLKRARGRLVVEYIK